jgi:2-keto-4-pentenoate hydratase/2-oxohepta-3-ene-1,7-dioic acid hydratase in catechol pathway
VPKPDKIICVGRNYRSRILEAREQPAASLATAGFPDLPPWL